MKIFTKKRIVIATALLVAVWIPWFVLVYPLVELTVFHGIYRYMRRTHEALCHRLNQHLLSTAPSAA